MKQSWKPFQSSGMVYSAPALLFLKLEESCHRSYSLTFVELTSTFMFSRTRIVSGSFLEAATCKAENPDPWAARKTGTGEKHGTERMVRKQRHVRSPWQGSMEAALLHREHPYRLAPCSVIQLISSAHDRLRFCHDSAIECESEAEGRTLFYASSLQQ